MFATKTRLAQHLGQVANTGLAQWPQFPHHPAFDLCHLAAKDFDKETRLALPEMAARTTKATADSEPCTVPASAGYRGLKNQLYRVEIHVPGAMGTATFKRSRENGSVVARITDGKDLPNLIVASTGPDANLGFQQGDRVEVIHDSDELAGSPGGLAKIGECWSVGVCPFQGDAEAGTEFVELLSETAMPQRSSSVPRCSSTDASLVL